MIKKWIITIFILSTIVLVYWKGVEASMKLSTVSMSGIKVGNAGTVPSSFFLLSDGTSNLLLSNGTDKLLIEGI